MIEILKNLLQFLLFTNDSIKFSIIIFIITIEYPINITIKKSINKFL